MAGLIGLCGLGVSCAGGPEARLTVPSYDPFTSKLVQLSGDLDGDGRLDQWSYLDGNRPLRGEADTDGDGRIDRWEYFNASAALEFIGTSSANDGVEDTWTWVVPNADGETRVAVSRRRDRQLDRREYFRGGVLSRVEEDGNADGRADRWDRYDGKVLREVALDTSLSRGRPDRRLLYDAQGQFEAIEEDPDGDGTFVRVPGDAAKRQPGAQS